MAFDTLSFQQVLALAAQSAPQDPIWPKFTVCVERKIAQA
jgi:hypothetical protein